MPADRGGSSQTSSRTIYVVFAAAAQKTTGAQLAQQIVAIQEDRERAEQAEADYAARGGNGDHVSERVFTQRYSLPYVAPAVKDLMGKG
jgi:hypothetical protein